MEVVSLFEEREPQGKPISQQVAEFVAAEGITTEEQPSRRPTFVLAPKEKNHER